jgi:hypothetical protein
MFQQAKTGAPHPDRPRLESESSSNNCGPWVGPGAAQCSYSGALLEDGSKEHKDSQEVDDWTRKVSISCYNLMGSLQKSLTFAPCNEATSSDPSTKPTGGSGEGQDHGALEQTDTG